MFAHFQDLVSGYVGPFDSLEALRDHAAFCKARGDGGELVEVVDAPPPGAMVMTPAEDRAWVSP